MAIDHFSFVTCDRCGSPGPLGENAGDARALAEYDRWKTRRHGRGFDLRSACAHGVRFNELSGSFVKTITPPALPGWEAEPPAGRGR